MPDVERAPENLRNHRRERGNEKTVAFARSSHFSAVSMVENNRAELSGHDSLAAQSRRTREKSVSGPN